MSVVKEKIIELLKEEGKFLTVSEIHEHLKKQSIVNTVPPIYRALKELMIEGKVERKINRIGRKKISLWGVLNGA